MKDGDLYVANVGDCRAVLGSRGGVATALTSDHTAGREDERRRIESSVSGELNDDTPTMHEELMISVHVC